ncbi:MAG: major facilitator superfamily transport protein [Bacteroidetes bacterium]|jgi:MFS family permease|nr:major facilitator superfamily transport protein [Bacteroidota bacterium]
MTKQTTHSVFNIIVIVAALGYFVDIYDLLLFSVERIDSLKEILGASATTDQLQSVGKQLLNWQMGGMLVGGIFWGILGDKKGRLSVLFGSILLYSLANIANGFVQSVPQYAILRFISGFGLAGELGAGITLVSETMSKERRGIGTMIVATIGVFGAVVAGFMGTVIENWRYSFFIGGGMGLLLLIMRIGVFESGMFEQTRQTNVSRGNLLSLFSSRKKAFKYLSIIMVAIPVWYVMGVLITFAPEMMERLGVTAFKPNPGKCVMFAYLGITIGDFASGMLSHFLKSRKKALATFMCLTLIAILMYFTIAKESETMFYTVVTFTGFATGYWAVFMSTASELFGTNIRSTVTTTSPNFVRGSLIFVTMLIDLATIFTGKVEAVIFVGGFIFLLAFLALRNLEETFGKELNYIEE